MSTTDRQASQLAEDRSVFKGLKCDSTVRYHVCLGRPTGRLQSGDDFRVAASCRLILRFVHIHIHSVIAVQIIVS